VARRMLGLSSYGNLRFFNWLFPAFSMLIICAMTGPSASAQVQAGRIVGTVTDPSKAAVPSATVVVTELGTNVEHTATTGPTGEYVVTPLNPGRYSVRASLTGFETIVKTGIEVQVDRSVRVDLELAIGDIATEVKVSAEVPVLNTESGTLGHVINNTQIVDLPLNGRGFYELARLTPGAALLPGTGNVLRVRPEFVNGTAISGVRGRMITFALDGMDVSEQHQGGTFIQTSIDALQEFKVQQNAYSAEFSRAGGMLNATTKSGTNDLHGVLFDFLRNDKLDARDFFALQREILKRNQFGATVGGPVLIPRLVDGRNRLFFLVSYEGMRERQGLVFNNLVPTAAMKRGDFSAPGLPIIYDPLTTAPNPSGTGTIRTPFLNNVIPQNRLSPQATFFNQFISDPNTAAGTASFAPSRALDQDQLTLRGDWNLASNHKFFARWSWHDNRQQDPNASPALGRALLETHAHNVGASLTSSLRPNLVHEFRYNYLTGIINLEGFLQGRDFNTEAGIKGFEDTRRPGVEGSFPDFLWSGFSSVRGSSFDQRPKTQDRLVHEFNDNLTWVHGRHIAKFGAKMRYYRPLFTDSKQYQGEWNFTGINTENPASPGGTGNAFADWMLGFPASTVRAFPGDVFGGQETYWQFFAHDDFKVHSRLTLNVGLRYEYTPWLEGYRGQLGTFDPTNSRPIIIGSETDQIDLDAQFAAKTAYPLFKDVIQTSSQAGLPLSITSPDRRQWAPRFGFAWRPLGERTVVRGGYGIFYETENTDGRVNLNMVPFKLDETVFNDRGTTPQRSMTDFFLGIPIGSFSTAPSMNPTYTRLRMGYDQHWNFGIQREFSQGMVLETDYVGNRGCFLNSGNRINDPTAGSGGIQGRRPYPRFGAITMNSQDISTIYHSLQVKLEKRLSAGLWYMGSYSFSRTIVHEPAPALGINAWEKALADFDIPHNFAWSTGYALPFGKGKTFGAGMGGISNALLGGWQLQGIVNLRSGRPFTPVVSRDVANIGVGGQRPHRIGSGILSNPTVETWFDRSAFTVPANFTFGNSGARILREDSFEVFDFSIFKEFQVREGSRLQFRAEFFNSTNTPNFVAPNTQVDTAAGGRVTATANSPRQIQFALKYNF
jgi:hypothetical protein